MGAFVTQGWGSLDPEESWVTGAEVSPRMRSWKRPHSAIRREKCVPRSPPSGADGENLVGDRRLYSCTPSSRCHSRQWLLLLRAEGVNWVWLIWVDRGPSVSSGLLVLVSRGRGWHQLKAPVHAERHHFSPRRKKDLLPSVVSRLSDVMGWVEFTWVKRCDNPSKVWWGTWDGGEGKILLREMKEGTVEYNSLLLLALGPVISRQCELSELLSASFSEISLSPQRKQSKKKKNKKKPISSRDVLLFCHLPLQKATVD